MSCARWTSDDRLLTIGGSDCTMLQWRLSQVETCDLSVKQKNSSMLQKQRSDHEKRKTVRKAKVLEAVMSDTETQASSNVASQFSKAEEASVECDPHAKDNQENVSSSLFHIPLSSLQKASQSIAAPAHFRPTATDDVKRRVSPVGRSPFASTVSTVGRSPSAPTLVLVPQATLTPAMQQSSPRRLLSVTEQEEGVSASIDSRSPRFRSSPFIGSPRLSVPSDLRRQPFSPRLSAPSLMSHHLTSKRAANEEHLEGALDLETQVIQSLSLLSPRPTLRPETIVNPTACPSSPRHLSPRPGSPRSTLPTSMFQPPVAQMHTQTQAVVAQSQAQAPQAQVVQAQAPALFNATAMNSEPVRAQSPSGTRSLSPGTIIRFRASSPPLNRPCAVGIQEVPQPAAPVQSSEPFRYAGMRQTEGTKQAIFRTNLCYPMRAQALNRNYVETGYQENVCRKRAMESVHTPVPGEKAGATDTSFKEYVNYGKSLLGDVRRKLQV